MNEFELVAESRADVGKGASRRLRRSGKIPGIVYGGENEPTMISMAHDDLFHHLEHEAFYSHILDLSVDGKSEQVVLKDLQRHVYKPEIMHVDFLRVSASEKLTMNVPIHFVNEEKCPGVKAGGIISHTMTELEIECLPKDLPEYIEIDMSAVELDASIHLAEINLPDGVEFYATKHGGDMSQPVVSVVMPRVSAAADEEDSGDDAEAGEEDTSAE